MIDIYKGLELRIGRKYIENTLSKLIYLKDLFHCLNNFVHAIIIIYVHYSSVVQMSRLSEI